jgi:hypothetical protein
MSTTPGAPPGCSMWGQRPTPPRERAAHLVAAGWADPSAPFPGRSRPAVMSPPQSAWTFNGPHDTRRVRPHGSGITLQWPCAGGLQAHAHLSAQCEHPNGRLADRRTRTLRMRRGRRLHPHSRGHKALAFPRALSCRHDRPGPESNSFAKTSARGWRSHCTTQHMRRDTATPSSSHRPGQLARCRPLA